VKRFATAWRESPASPRRLQPERSTLGIRGRATFRLEVPGREPPRGDGRLRRAGIPLHARCADASGRDLEPADRHAVLVTRLWPANSTQPAMPLGARFASMARFGRSWACSGYRLEHVLRFAPAARHPLSHPRAPGGMSRSRWKWPPSSRPMWRRCASELAAAQPGSTVASSKTLWQHYQDSPVHGTHATRCFMDLALLARCCSPSPGLHGITSALFARRSQRICHTAGAGGGSSPDYGDGGCERGEAGRRRLVLGLAIAFQSP